MQGRSSSGSETKPGIPLIAIGASAGGLEPLERFFETAPTDSGWAFVVVQHLSPDYRSMMDELLARRSTLAIKHIEDGVQLAPNTIFLNRANMIVKLDGDTFRTMPFAKTDALPHLPIDLFFTSIADRNVSETIAVILSGSGSDGTKGARTLYDAGAAVLVQSPAEAGFNSMPRSVLTAGNVDQVLEAAEMPAAIAEIFRYGKHELLERRASNDPAPRGILKLIEDAHELDFSDYKPENVWRRIERRQHLRGFQSVDDYRNVLARDPVALEELYHDLLIGVTRFYRDTDAIKALREQAIDRIVKEPPDNLPLRIWVPACASGEEAYTIAIELSEAMRTAKIDRKFRIIATDVHRRSIDFASVGTYPREVLEDVPDDIRERYFNKVRDQYVVDPALRQKIIFSVHDVLSDPPFMHLDLISCRNLLIYLNEDPQGRVISMFLFGLRKDGYLLLGPSESIGKFSSEFRVVNGRWRLFQKTSNKRLLDRSILSTKVGSFTRHELPSDRRPVRSRANLPGDVAELRNRNSLIKSYDALLKRYAPSSILVSESGAVLSWFGAAGAFIDTMNNLAEWTVEDIVSPDLHFPINVAIEKLRAGQLDNYVRRVNVTSGSGKGTVITVSGEPLNNVPGSKLMLITLDVEENVDHEEIAPDAKEEHSSATTEPTDAADNALLSRRIQDLERDLRLTEETLQHVTERLEASGEELQASNEELQASNEELQASNEELQSSNEELHAVNEELVSLSSEHEHKIEMLSDLNQNTELVLGILGVGVVFVDSQCRIQRFSEIVAQRFELLAQDIGRSLSVVGPRLGFVDLLDMTKKIIDGGEEETISGLHDDAHLRVIARRLSREPVVSDRVLGAVLIFHWSEGDL